MNQFPFNEPVFWELLGAFILLGALLVAVYCVYVFLYLVFLFLRDNFYYSRLPVLTLVDPVFGEIRSQGGDYWSGEIDFPHDFNCDSIYIDAGESGPSEYQRSLYRKIEFQYPTLKAEIELALREYVKECFLEYGAEDWTFTLSSLDLPVKDEFQTWSANYFADTDMDGDMGYEVVMKNWNVSMVCGSD